MHSKHSNIVFTNSLSFFVDRCVKMLQQKEKTDEIRFTKKELLLMAKSRECRQRSRSLYTAKKSIVEDIASRDNIRLEGTTSVPNTSSWRNRNIPRNIWIDDPLNEYRGDEPLGNGVTNHGTLSLRLHSKIRVDITLDRAIRIMNFKNNIALALSASGSTAALLHPNGRVYQYGSRVEILAYDKHVNGNNKYAKMWYKGVSFTSDQCALVYLVDSAGTRTTTDSFSDLSTDFSLQVFYNESVYGASHIMEGMGMVEQSSYWLSDDGTDNWLINNVRVSQTVDGLVRVGRNNGKYNLRTSPSNGSAGISTPFLHCTGSLGQTRHLFVRRGERRMHYDGTSFIVRNAGHSAGFDDKHQLKVY